MPWQARRAHGEIVMVRVEFDDDRLLHDMAIPRAHARDRILDEPAHVSLERPGLVLVRAQDQARILGEVEPVQAVQQAQRVHHLGVVAVALERAREVSLRIVEPVDAQQVDPEGGMGAVEPGFDFYGPFEHGDRLFVTPGDHIEVRDGLEDRAMMWARLQRPPGPFARYVAPEVVGCREERHRPEPRARIVRLDERQYQFPPGRDIPHGERPAGQHEAGARVVRDALEHGVRDGARPGLEPALRHLGQANLRIDVRAIEFERFAEEVFGVGVLVRVQVEPAPARAYVRVFRSCGDRRVKGPMGRLPVAETPERLRLHRWRGVEQHSAVALGGGRPVGVAEPAAVVRGRLGIYARREDHTHKRPGQKPPNPTTANHGATCRGRACFVPLLPPARCRHGRRQASPRSWNIPRRERSDRRWMLLGRTAWRAAGRPWGATGHRKAPAR